jgi:ketosteroid isomerase-like protein
VVKLRVHAGAAVAAALIVTASLAGCATQPKKPTTAADEAAIAEFNQRYLKAINIMLAPGRPPLVGKEANDAANARAAQMFKIEEHWTPLETVISGDLAYQRGTFTVAASPKAASGGASAGAAAGPNIPRKTSGNFLRIYKRQPDGSWRMVRDMFNSDQPATPPPN